MNIIFLDIDGVLVTSRHLAQNNDVRDEFDPRSVENLNALIKETSAKIVVSSNWRMHKSLLELQNIFKKNNVIGDIVDVTPFYNDFTIMRGKEIQDYMTKLLGTIGEIRKYVIFDDEENMLHLAHRYVQTDPRVGITEDDVLAALEIMK